MESSTKTGRNYRSDAFYLNVEQAGNSLGNENMTINIPEYIGDIHRAEGLVCVVLSTFRVDWDYVRASLLPMCFSFKDSLAQSTGQLVPLLVLHGSKFIKESPIDSDSHLDDSKYSVPARFIADPLVSVKEVTPQIRYGNKRRFLPGVHHPKYALLFTKRGLHVIITTANFNGSGSLDATWTQFFPLISGPPPTENYAENDFGVVLEDFIIKQSQQILIDGNSSAILSWIQSHTQLTSSSLRQHYDFSEASVKLVSTVPCRVAVPSIHEEQEAKLYENLGVDRDLKAPVLCAGCKEEQSKLVHGFSATNEYPGKYGSWRIHELLTTAECNPHKRRLRQTSKHARTGGDLIAQPTSINGIFQDFFSQWVSHLTPPDRAASSQDQTLREEEDFQCKILWPTLKSMQEEPHTVNESSRLPEASLKPRGCIDNNTSSSDETENDIDSDGGKRGIMFFLPKDFNKMSEEHRSLLHTYIPKKCIETAVKYSVPHIKTYCRLLVDQEESKECSECDKLMWLWLTSACLSRGAQVCTTLLSLFKPHSLTRCSSLDLNTFMCTVMQGQYVGFSICNDCKHVRSGYWDYKNFELGVLFMSDDDKQYVAPCNSCSTTADSRDKRDKRRSLPIPYEIRAAQPYIDGAMSSGGPVLTTLPYFTNTQDVATFGLKAKDGSHLPYNAEAKGAQMVKRRSLPSRQSSCSSALETITTGLKRPLSPSPVSRQSSKENTPQRSQQCISTSPDLSQASVQSDHSIKCSVILPAADCDEVPKTCLNNSQQSESDARFNCYSRITDFM